MVQQPLEMATHSRAPSERNLFSYYANQKKVQQQCSESTSSLQMSMRHMNLQDPPQAIAAEPRPASIRPLRPRTLDLSSQPSQDNSQ